MNISIHFLFISTLSAFILLIYDLRGPNQSSAVISNEQKGFPKLVLVSTSVDKTQTVQRQLILLNYQNTSKNLQSLQRDA